MPTPIPGSVEAIVADTGSVVTSAVGWVGTVAQTIVNNPLLLVFCILGLVGLGVGLFGRLINVN